MKIKGLFRKNNPILFFSIRLADAIGITLGGYFAYLLRFDDSGHLGRFSLAIAVGAVIALVMLPRFGCYRSWRGTNVFFDVHRLIVGWGAVLLVCLALAFLTKTSTLFSRQWVILWAVSSPLAMLLCRYLLNLLLSRIEERGWNQSRVVIVGAGDLGQTIARRLNAAPWTGYSIAGFFDDDPELSGGTVGGTPVLGTLSVIASVIETLKVDEVWLALPMESHGKIKQIVHDLRHTPVMIRYVPDIFEFRLINHDVSQIGGIPIIDLNVTPMVGVNRILKAIEDYVLASLILILISPLMLFIAIGVRLSSPGPVFYRQERVSWNGQPFEMLKFRSMPVSAEAETGPKWATPGEQRATPFGRFLRRTSLDELPQFINVLKGEMSIVGPRPERPYFIDKFKDEIPDYMQKHLVKAGITGWAQVNGWRGDTDLEKRIEYDLFYIENWSLWFDLKIIFLTVFKGFVSKNAY